MNIKPVETVLSATAATCISAADYKKLQALAEENGVTVSTYLRGIITDAIADEAMREKPVRG